MQIAFIEALQARGIEPDLVVGTSVGALNESYVAFHQPGREVQYLARDGMGGFQAGVYEGAVRSG